MYNKNLRILSGMALAAGVLLGLAGCGGMPSKSIQTEEIIVPDVDDTTAEYDAQGQKQETESAQTGSEDNQEDSAGLGEAEVVNAEKFGNPKEVLDGMSITSNVEVIKTEEDELQIEFELENVGLCTFAAGKGEEFILPGETFVDSTKIEWTASTADGESVSPYMRVNEGGDMFMIDWAYHGYCFAIYGKSPQNTSDRDMAGKIALAIIYNLSGAE
ncbi:hypothetical protein D5278_09030 [bacterium 1XD21-13]|nr:hypothetical protein [bacterium 1XD21-13]